MYGLTDNVIFKYDNVLFGAQPYHVRECIYNTHFSEVK
jgi:hypothetical protein